MGEITPPPGCKVKALKLATRCHPNATDGKRDVPSSPTNGARTWQQILDVCWILAQVFETSSRSVLVGKWCVLSIRHHELFEAKSADWWGFRIREWGQNGLKLGLGIIWNCNKLAHFGQSDFSMWRLWSMVDWKKQTMTEVPIDDILYSILLFMLEGNWPYTSLMEQVDQVESVLPHLAGPIWCHRWSWFRWADMALTDLQHFQRFKWMLLWHWRDWEIHVVSRTR